MCELLQLCAFLSSGVSSHPIKWFCVPCIYLALYPGILTPLTPVFVTCGTAWSCATAYLDMEEWHISRKTASEWVHDRSQIRTIEQLGTRYQAVLATFLGFRMPLYSCTERVCYSSTYHPTSRYVIAHDQFNQTFPHISTASDMAKVRGYWLPSVSLISPPSWV